MATFTITDINDGTTYIVAANDVNAIYDIDDYRILIKNDGTRYDVSETFASLTHDAGGGHGGGGGGGGGGP
jgi:hypothetical protein